jgi:hypothetical protein
MSHFTVLVIGNDAEEQLAPYQENNIGDCPEEYLEFQDCTDEINKQWEENIKTISEWYSDGTVYLNKEDYDKFKNDGRLTTKKPYSIHSLNQRVSVSCDSEEKLYGLAHSLQSPEEFTMFLIEGPKEIPIRDKYKDIQEFANDYHGYEKDEEDRYGYTTNPNSKWDWYQLGGRWTGFFKLKKGANGQVGEVGLMTESPEDGYVDCAFKKDIDFEGMKAENLVKYNGLYDKFEQEMANNPETAKNKAYWEYGIENKGDKDNWITETREEYVSRHYYPTTYALVKDSEWYAKGEMGWWGLSDDNNKDNWDKEFFELIDSVSDDTLLSVYDCHI